jgi:hypothetical protein
MAYVRECGSCGHVDERDSFDEPKDDRAALAGGAPWSCPRCGGGDFRLVSAAPVGGG